MKKWLKILLGFFGTVIVLILSLFIIRGINGYRYRQYEITKGQELYENPADLTLYDTEMEKVEVNVIEESLLNGFHLVPDHLKKEGIIVTFGGSEGSSNYEVAQELARKGYEVYSLFYFGPGDLPDELKEVPLEFFEDFLTYHEKNSQTKGPITVLGDSKGAELTLNLATYYDEIDQIVVYAPASYSFFSLDQENSDYSSWTYHGKEIPYLSNREGSMTETFKMLSSFVIQAPVKYYPVFESVIENADDETLENARIKIEEFAGESLVFSGGDDLMWPSAAMAEKLEDHAKNIETYNYPEAGHAFALPPYLKAGGATLAFGGTKAENQKALEESNEILFEKLEEWHK